MLPLALIAASGGARAQAIPEPTGAGTPAEPTAPTTLRRGALGWWTEASIRTQLTATNNANFGDSSDRAADLIIEVMPALSFNREGDRLRVNGYVAANAIGYVDGTQTNRILPQANVLANLEAVENLFFIDAGVVASQTIENAFLPRSEFSSTNNQITYTQARLAPYLQNQIGQNIHWLIRSDNTYTWTSQASNPLGDAYFGRHLAQISRDPIPWGLTLQVSRDQTAIQDSVQPDQVLDTALAIVDYAFTPQLTMGLRGGYESTTYTASTTSGAIYGANIAWYPSPATSVVGYWESRFYGPSYQFNASHRHYRLATTLSAYRSISTFPQLLMQLPGTTSTSALLDAILVARFPDPLVRSQQVQELIERQALPEALPGGAFIYNQSANINTGANLGFALIGARNTLALNIFYLKTQLLPDARVPTTFLTFNNNEQVGAGITLTHRVTPTVNLNGTISGFQTEGFGPTEGQETRQGLASLQLNWQLSPRNTAFAGTRYQYQRQRGELSPFGNSSEASIFVGLFHGF